MIISVKTTGLLGKFLPEGSERNRGDVDLPDNSSVQALLDQLAIPEGRCLVTINGALLQKEEFTATIIQPTDAVVLMAPLAAG